MSGFLRDLIGRSGEAANVLQRRPRALFEPASPAVSILRTADVSSGDPGTIEPIRTDTSRERPAPVAPREHEPARAAPTPSASLLSATSMPRHQPLEHRVAERMPPVAHRQTRSDEAMAPSDSLQMATGRQAKRRVGSVDAPDARRPSAEPSQKASIGAEPRKAIVVAALAHVGAPTAIRSVTQPAEPASPQRETRSAVLLVKARTNATPPSVPTPAPVHITIGRVEVRASPAARSAPKTSPAKPRLSLDDYLRERSGDTR